MVEHVPVGKIGLGDEIIDKVIRVHPLDVFGVFVRIGGIRGQGPCPNPLIFAVAAGQGSDVPADDVHSVRVHPIVGGHIILVLVFVQVVDAPVLAVYVYDHQPGFSVFHVQALDRLGEEAVPQPGLIPVLAGIAQHQGGKHGHVAVGKKGIIRFALSVGSPEEYGDGFLPGQEGRGAAGPKAAAKGGAQGAVGFIVGEMPGLFHPEFSLRHGIHGVPVVGLGA